MAQKCRFSQGSTGKCLNANCTKKLDWGVGPDARGGNQPRGTHVVGNLVREIGIWQKQSSFWFQATTMQTHIERNVHFNGPRAGLNFVRTKNPLNPPLLRSLTLTWHPIKCKSRCVYRYS